jgi:hypothetical protein
VQAGLKLEILLPHPPKCWDERPGPLHLTVINLKKLINTSIECMCSVTYSLTDKIGQVKNLSMKT